MSKIPSSFLLLLLVVSVLTPGRLAAAVKYDAQIPQLVFAAQELEGTLKEAGREDLQVALLVKPDGASPEAFDIKADGTQIEVIGADPNGAMYGGIEVAEYLKLGLPLRKVSRNPMIRYRGIKMNIPLDCRTPSYCDKGDAAQNNIVTEEALPAIEFVNLADDEKLAAKENLEVRVTASAPSGIEEIKLYLNGPVVDGPNGEGPYVWSAATDTLLENLQKDWYCLEAMAVDGNGFVARTGIYINVDNATGDKNDWKSETYAVVLSDGDALTSGHGDTQEESENDQVTIRLEKLEARLQFDSSGKLKLRDDFLGINLFKSRSKADPGPRRCEFKEGAVTTYNLVEPVSVLWSSRNWHVNSQGFKSKSPAESGFTGPFEFVVTRGRQLAITGLRDGKRRIAWFANPNYEDWDGQIGLNCR